MSIDHSKEVECYVKVIVEKDSDKMVGFHYLAPNAGEFVQGIAVVLKMGITRQ